MCIAIGGRPLLRISALGLSRLWNPVLMHSTCSKSQANIVEVPGCDGCSSARSGNRPKARDDGRRLKTGDSGMFL